MLNIQCFVDETCLFFKVSRHIAARRCCRCITTNIIQLQLRIVIMHHTTHVMLAAVPGALVHWLFLTPPDVLQIGIGRQSVTQLLFRERIKLLKTNKRNMVRSEEHTSELQSRENLVCRLLLEKKKQ